MVEERAEFSGEERKKLPPLEPRGSPIVNGGEDAVNEFNHAEEEEEAGGTRRRRRTREAAAREEYYQVLFA